MSQAVPYRFAVLTHMPTIRDIMDEWSNDPSFTLDFFRIAYNTSALGVPKLFEEGYEVILFYSSFGLSLLKDIGHSVVLIQKTDLDTIKALQRARSLCRHVALTVHEDEFQDVPFLENLLDMHIDTIPYNSVAMLRQGIRQAIAQGLTTLVGGGVSAAMASQFNVQFVSISPNPHSIRLALEQAKALAKARREERQSREQLEAMFKLFREGVLCVSQNGETIFSNDKAFEILKIAKSAGPEAFESLYNPLRISEVLHDGVPRIENIVSINGEQLVVTTLPISVHAWLHGAVTFINDVHSIHTITGRIREVQHKTGFVARFRLEDIKGEDAEMQRLKKMVQLYAPHDAALCIHGETGTGKELLAQSLHNASARRQYPFVAINCAALPESLLESELFGYEEGAFTGARRGGKPGVFEMAHKGTLFLDEVGDMGPGAQMRLLRILETKELVRVGGNRIIPVDIRVISASHKLLSTLVQEGSFRQDLFYRLAVLRLRIPPLRQRLRDIPLLLEDVLRKHGRSLKDMQPPMLHTLTEYDWPGNVRELHAFMESFLILGGQGRLDSVLFQELFRDWSFDDAAPIAAKALSHIPPFENKGGDKGLSSLKERLHQARQDIVQETVRQCAWNKSLAASRLGISYNTLWRILGENRE